ncbi:MAG: nucleotidyltransferase domain-containing protein [Clostridia bacterium]|nr:nucleotidyltransferase domain-containing protein [Clostridia bacterium]
MIHTEEYLAELREALAGYFGERLVYIGLQGSYLRGEADENSDFDVMLVIDGLVPADLDAYRDILRDLGEFERSCGFVCGREELKLWNPLEACHVLHTTKDIHGELKPLMPEYTPEDVRNFVRLSVGNLFHELCHRYVHRGRDRSGEKLCAAYQPVFFILQNLYYLRCGVFVQTKKELSELLGGEDREILLTAMRMKAGVTFDFDEAYAKLFGWCQKKLKEVGKN